MNAPADHHQHSGHSAHSGHSGHGGHGGGREPIPGQLGLFGGPGHQPDPPSKPSPVARTESNNVELMHTIAGNADRAGYLLAGPSERVYARDTGHDARAVRVPRWEEDAVHQLLRRRWLYRGGGYRFTCGAADLTGTTVHTTRETRARVARWEQLQRAPKLPPGVVSCRPARSDAINVDTRRRTL